jgi:hypothetical protein
VTAQLEADYYVLAAVLYGSLARGEPWEKSDIDLMFVLRDDPQNRAPTHAWMTADDINVFAELYPRTPSSALSKERCKARYCIRVVTFRLLFTKDESIAAWLSESARIGERTAFQLLRTWRTVLPLEKATKWLVASATGTTPHVVMPTSTRWPASRWCSAARRRAARRSIRRSSSTRRSSRPSIWT